MVALDFWGTHFYMNELDKLFKSNMMTANRLSFNIRQPENIIQCILSPQWAFIPGLQGEHHRLSFPLFHLQSQFLSLHKPAQFRWLQYSYPVFHQLRIQLHLAIITRPQPTSGIAYSCIFWKISGQNTGQLTCLFWSTEDSQGRKKPKKIHTGNMKSQRSLRICYCAD